uniref:Uncharacterized protein n=1 Tax=Anguilla anguilla TaxID=7936 RepID=A0A0E9XQI9_ANGAN
MFVFPLHVCEGILRIPRFLPTVQSQAD